MSVSPSDGNHLGGIQTEKKRKHEGEEALTQDSKKRKIESTESSSPKSNGTNQTQKSYKDRKNPSRKKSNQIFEHGNYLDYYGYRNKGYSGRDPRLSVLDPSLFTKAKCLDVGCNAGIFTLDLAVVFDIQSIHGVDIDHRLINKARGNFTKYCKVASLPKTDLDVDSSIEVSSKKDISRLVTFKYDDYTKTPETPGAYDVITCMSVIKWIHINNGDEGLRATFKKFAVDIKKGGHLILEPQPWSSYRPRKLSQKGKESYGKLVLRPENFTELLSEEGFELVSETKPEISIGGFSCRSIFTYKNTGNKRFVQKEESVKEEPVKEQEKTKKKRERKRSRKNKSEESTEKKEKEEKQEQEKEQEKDKKENQMTVEEESK
eukprot:TRINITY_DN5309_c0_g1_i1.p1 TRINITY_DN5309_c0_g1~~TRINITY_DN5309_c0_g1_i1.p1  ORF type:complete len:376 (+),score=108.30 TRINITY_DN5309_c0_g1_i1:107-1234(+)